MDLSQTTWDHILVAPFTSYVTLHLSLPCPPLSLLYVPCMQNGDNNNIYLEGCCGIKEDNTRKILNMMPGTLRAQ